MVDNETKFQQHFIKRVYLYLKVGLVFWSRQPGCTVTMRLGMICVLLGQC